MARPPVLVESSFSLGEVIHGAHEKARRQAANRSCKTNITQAKSARRARYRSNPQRCLAVPWRCCTQDLARRRSAFLGPCRQSCRARSARQENTTGGGQDRASRSDDVPLDRCRTQLEGGKASARFCESSRGRER